VPQGISGISVEVIRQNDPPLLRRSIMPTKKYVRFGAVPAKSYKGPPCGTELTLLKTDMASVFSNLVSTNTKYIPNRKPMGHFSSFPSFALSGICNSGEKLTFAQQTLSSTISTTFCYREEDPSDLTIISADNTIFFVHKQKLLAKSTNFFADLLFLAENEGSFTGKTSGLL
jgi:hypothetical protein